MITISSNNTIQSCFNTLVKLVIKKNGILTIKGNHSDQPTYLDFRVRGWKMTLPAEKNAKNIKVEVIDELEGKNSGGEIHYTQDKKIIENRMKKLKSMLSEKKILTPELKDRKSELIAAKCMLKIRNFSKIVS